MYCDRLFNHFSYHVATSRRCACVLSIGKNIFKNKILSIHFLNLMIDFESSIQNLQPIFSFNHEFLFVNEFSSCRLKKKNSEFLLETVFF